jgi:hypothetical protein
LQAPAARLLWIGVQALVASLLPDPYLPVPKLWFQLQLHSVLPPKHLASPSNPAVDSPLPLPPFQPLSQAAFYFLWGLAITSWTFYFSALWNEARPAVLLAVIWVIISG